MNIKKQEVIDLTKQIKLTIQEIVNDFYNLAQEEGYLSGLGDCQGINKKNEMEYHYNMKDMIDKYIPNWNEKVDKEYFSDISDADKGLILSTILTDNFKEIFYQLI